MNAISISNVFSALLTRYRRQVTDLDAAEDQGEIDRLTNASQETLVTLCGTRPRDATALADKIDALIGRYDDFGTVPIKHVRELLADAHHLATEPGMTLAWVRLWHDLGCALQITAEGERLYWQPEPHLLTKSLADELPPHLVLRSEAEASGAAKVLLSLLRLAGKRASEGVFAFADVVREG